MDYSDKNGNNGSWGRLLRDRRLGMRFPIEMELKYRVGAKATTWAPGRTINISSSGMLVRADSVAVKGSSVDLSLDWPRLLDNRIPLRLMVKGRVVRAGNGEVAVTFQRFEFRTARAPGRAELMDVAAAEQA